MADDAQVGGPDSRGSNPPAIDLGDAGLEDVVEVGRGGFAAVYRAYQPEFDRIVAVKVLTGVIDDQARSRLDRERRAMGVLSAHPNIIAVYGSGTTPAGQPYIVMEHAPAGSLADQITRDGPLPWREAAEIGVKLGDALTAAHNAKVLHRDIKPENVLVSTYGEPMLADFGIARLAGGAETRTGVVTMSLGHAAPEVLEGARPSESSDVYSLASTVHALISGRAPFMRETDESMIPVITRIATEPPPDLRTLGAPDGVCSVLERAMAKAPADRYATSLEFTDALREAIAGRGPAAAPATTDAPPVEPAKPSKTPKAAKAPKEPKAKKPTVADADGDTPKKRRPVLIALVVALVVAGGIGVAVSGGGGGGGGDTDNGGTLAVEAEVSLPLVSQIAVGAGAAFALVDAENVTLADATASIARLDRDSAVLLTQIPLGASIAQAMTVGDGAVWACLFDDTESVSVIRIDIDRAQRIDLGDSPFNCSGNVVGNGALWVATQTATGAGDAGVIGELVKIDTLSSEVVDRFNVGEAPVDVAFGFGAVWVIDGINGTLIRVDAATSEITDEFSVGRAPSLVEVGEGAVWIVDAADGSLLKVDPDSGEVIDRKRNFVSFSQEGGVPQIFAVGLGSLWAIDTARGELVEFDSDTLDVLDRLAIGRFPTAVTTGEGSVWVSDPQGEAIFRINPAAG